MKKSNLIALFFITPVLFFKSYVNAQTLHFYYGTLHAHSSYSDGNKDAAISMASIPYHNYAFAKTAQHFDFLGISEHNHNGAGMQRADYLHGLQQADSANQDGLFVAMYGMEWGVIGPPGGHVLVYGMNQLIGWDSVAGLPNYDTYNAKLDYAGLFTLIARTPGAFASLAHPATTDYGNLFANPVDATFDSAIVGSAIRSGPAFSTDTVYSDPSSSSFEARYKDALKRGYHLGAVLDHDNHNTTFGKMAASRTVVLAPSLTRNDILEAIRNRRVQASDDWNVQVTFTINGRPLGTIFTDTINPTISVSVFDPDLETTSTISIVYGVPGSGNAPTTLTSSATGSLNYTHIVPFGSTYYYYAVVTQADGDKIFTAPIWASKMTTLPVTLVSFTAQKTPQKITCEWTTASEWNARYFELEKSVDGYSFEPIHKQNCSNTNNTSYYVYDDRSLSVERVYYRLKQVDMDGKVYYSKIISVNGLQADNKGITITPNPFDDHIVVHFGTDVHATIALTLTNAMGELIWSKQIAVAESDVAVQLPKDIAAGMYTIRVQDNFNRYSKRLIKVIGN
jgi:hypothetical protein